jgi:hypothetical protein
MAFQAGSRGFGRLRSQEQLIRQLAENIPPETFLFPILWRVTPLVWQNGWPEQPESSANCTEGGTGRKSLSTSRALFRS